MKVFKGNFITATDEAPLVLHEDKLIGVYNKKIIFIDNAANLEELKLTQAFGNEDIVQLGEWEFLMPGLIDTHIHASQFVNAGTALDLPLLEWLQKYTFPTEAMFKVFEFAKEAYTAAVKRVLINGTTTALYNATIHTDASVVLCDICQRLGQRALVGKVCMDQNSPDYYIETTAESVQEMDRFIECVKAKNYSLVEPVVLPRFAIAASKELLTQLADIAQKHGGVRIQSHLSENKNEIQDVLDMFPWAKHYTDVYDKCNILTSKTSMAHGVHLSENELDVLKQRGVGISHCPNSNTSLKSGMCDVRRLLDHGIKVGLGTDVSGGFHPSVFDAIRYTCQTSNTLSMERDQTYKVIDYKEAFRLATLGGSRVLNLEDTVGTLEVGKEFDALRVNPAVTDSPLNIFRKNTLEDIIQKFFYLGDDRNITEVYIAGKKVCPF